MGDLIVTADNGLVELGLTGVERIAQRVRLIWTTPKRSVPLDRGFGLETKYIDRPSRKARAGLAVDGIEATEYYEPNIKVKSVEWAESADEALDGTLKPKITVALVEG